MSEEDLKWQTWIIKASFASLETHTADGDRLRLCPIDRRVRRQDLLDEARAIGETACCSSRWCTPAWLA